MHQRVPTINASAITATIMNLDHVIATMCRC
jgi:hypothetical protein